MRLRQLDKTYEPKQVEERWYRFWTERRYFHAPLEHPGDPYTIVMPPPNITGSLHIGHALNNTLQDILIRWRRMQGRNTLWVPGTDHAGIATQNVVERQLLAEGLTRETVGREAFIKRVWEWKAKSGGTILQQLKRLGASCDWDRVRFTMDEGLSRAVREVFVRLYEEGLIYRGERLINWCPNDQTALSDIEVEHEETKAKLYYIRYALTDDPSTSLVVATTRPETMLGDTAVAVHPDDPRYQHLIGKTVKLPLTQRAIPIIADSILVDPKFATGVVKVTPAHDFNDFEAGVRHQLPRLSILDRYARLDPEGLRAAQVEPGVIEDLRELLVEKARARLESHLQARGALVKQEDYTMALGRCYRCKAVVEPFLSPQWFVKIQPLAQPAIQAVQEGRIRLIPESWVNNYLGWMREIKDWCISRQIWWGHQIPAWYCKGCHEDAIVEISPARPSTEAPVPPSKKAFMITSAAKPIVARTAPAHCPDCGAGEFIRDPDVLDTWFSSALWPFSTLGWPEQTPELARFYPTSTLITGLDILFFWVARMIMMGLKFMGDVPFRDVYIHALVRDAEGQKMSKSKGNVIDPLGVMDTYGTDALRFTLAAMASPGRDIRLAEERIAGYRNFANKIWNVARFILMHLEGRLEPAPLPQRPFADRWILSRLNWTIRQVTAALEQYRFDQAAGHLYQFIWHEYADWYLEMAKLTLQESDSPEANRTRATLLESFEVIQRLLHPLMPFITEEIWQSLPKNAPPPPEASSQPWHSSVATQPATGPRRDRDSIMIQRYPSPVPEWDDKEVETVFGTLERFVSLVRTGRALLNYPPAKQLSVFGASTDQEEMTRLATLRPQLEHLGRTLVHLAPIETWPARNVLRLVSEGISVGLVVEGEVDLQKVADRLAKQRQANLQETTRLEGKLANADFTSRAPQEVIEEHRQRLRLLKEEQALLTSSEQQLREMMKK